MAPFKFPEVRHAAHLVIDRVKLMQTIFNSIGKVTTDLPDIVLSD